MVLVEDFGLFGETASDDLQSNAAAPPRSICSSRLLPEALPLGVHLGEHACLGLLHISSERWRLYVDVSHTKRPLAGTVREKKMYALMVVARVLFEAILLSPVAGIGHPHSEGGFARKIVVPAGMLGVDRLGFRAVLLSPVADIGQAHGEGSQAAPLQNISDKLLSGTDPWLKKGVRPSGETSHVMARKRPRM